MPPGDEDPPAITKTRAPRGTALTWRRCECRACHLHGTAFDREGVDRPGPPEYEERWLCRWVVVVEVGVLVWFGCV